MYLRMNTATQNLAIKEKTDGQPDKHYEFEATNPPLSDSLTSINFSPS
jgi:hypothetical protein